MANTTWWIWIFILSWYWTKLNYRNKCGCVKDSHMKPATSLTLFVFFPHPWPCPLPSPLPLIQMIYSDLPLLGLADSHIIKIRKCRTGSCLFWHDCLQLLQKPLKNMEVFKMLPYPWKFEISQFTWEESIFKYIMLVMRNWEKCSKLSIIKILILKINAPKY